MEEKPDTIRCERLLIAGLGNELLMDDGVGIHAVRSLQQGPLTGSTRESRGEVRIVEIGTAVLDGLHLFEWADCVLALDAVQAGNPPGTIYELNFSGEKAREQGRSMHALDLREAFRMLDEGKRPCLVMLGVEPGSIDYGLELSPEVGKVLPEFIETILGKASALINW